jgi:hypothetical protein
LKDLDWLRRLLKACEAARDRLGDEPSLGALKADLDAYCSRIERKLEQAQSIQATDPSPW